MKLLEMAKLFNVSSVSAGSRSVIRFDTLLDSDVAIAGLFGSICQELTP
jgi:hypothetical protein